MQAVFTFLLGFSQQPKSFPTYFLIYPVQNLPLIIADVSFNKFCSPRVNILDKLLLGSFKHCTWRGEPCKSSLHPSHNTSHFSGTQPALQHSVHPTLLQEFPFPSSQKKKICTKHLHMLPWLPGDRQYGSQISEPKREMETGAKPEFLC